MRLFCFARAWVGLVVDLGEVLEIKVSIDLRGADIRMTEQFLHRPQVATGFQQVAGKGMPQGMWVDITRGTLPSCPVLDALLHRAYSQPFATTSGKDGRLAATLWTQLLPGMQGLNGLVAHRQHTCFRALAGDAHSAIIKIYIAVIQTNQFRQSQS